MHMSFVPDTQNKEFQDALNLIQYTRQSVFLTGKAGTGKSTFLRYICEHTKKKHVVLAPTGIAAINAGGSTLHSFFKLPFYPLLPDDPNFSLQRGRIHEFFKYTKPHRKLLEELELVIIDEISMVRADIIDAVDRILRVYSRNLREPFGGKQILLVGDVFQLEPVVKGDERDILNRFYPTPYFFSARVFGQIDLVSIELQTVYRQAIDRALKQAQADVQYVAAAKAFDQGDFETFLNEFFKAIHSRYDIEKPVVQRLIRKKLNIINRLKADNACLKQDMEKQRKRLQDYAREYYAMGNECITQARDARAALANYDKALELYPEYTDAWVRKGVTLFNENQYQEAEECLNRAVRLRPAEFKTVYNRGKLRLKLGNIEGAIADLDKATTLKPEHAGAHELFGDALMQTGKEVEAALQWRLAEELRKKRSSK